MHVLLSKVSAVEFELLHEVQNVAEFSHDKHDGSQTFVSQADPTKKNPLLHSKQLPALQKSHYVSHTYTEGWIKIRVIRSILKTTSLFIFGR